MADLVSRALRKWHSDNALGAAAATAYYALFCVIPVLLVAINAVDAIFKSANLETRIAEGIRESLGPQSAGLVTSILGNTAAQIKSLPGAILGLSLALMGSIGLFGQVRRTLDRMWDAAPREGRGLKGFLFSTLPLFLMVMIFGLVLLFSAFASAAMTALLRYTSVIPAGVSGTLLLADSIISIAVGTVLFGITFWVLPDVRFRAKDILLGAFVTSALFTLGKACISIYVQMSDVASVYGAGGAVMVFLLFVYYAAQIFYFGAEFTYVQANKKK